jgi:hypothetical protein
MKEQGLRTGAQVSGRGRTTARAALAVLCLVTSVLAAVTPTVLAPPAGAEQPVAQPQVVSATPSAATPSVNDGAVHTITQIGSTIVAGGAFTSVTAPGSTVAVKRTNIFAFDAVTGALITTFAPVINGEVDALAPGPDGTSVYIGGQFTTVNAAARRGVVRLNLATGTPTAGWVAPVINGAVNDLLAYGTRLYLAGTFTLVNAVPHAGLATVSAANGHLDQFMNIQLSGHHNYGIFCKGSTCVSSATGARSMSMSPDHTQLVVIGNFRLTRNSPKAADTSHDQIVRIKLGGLAVVNDTWATAAFHSGCHVMSFDSWVRDVSFSPDGSYFVVASSGGPSTGQNCDSAIRFENASSGLAAKLTWVDFSGGDSLWSVAVTSAAVYVGGHARWMNNPSGRDSAQPGAVARPGIAALDPLTGLPLSWNPGRNPRGAGAWALLVTPTGLWVGSDTEYIGNFRFRRPRIAFFPLAGGSTPARGNGGTLPNDIVALGSSAGSPGSYGDTVTGINFTGSKTATPYTLPAAGVAWSTIRAAVQIDGKILYGLADGTMHLRSFDGRTFGPDQVINPYVDPAWSTVKTGSNPTLNETYLGIVPSFYSEITSLTSMFYLGGRLYYTRAGSPHLYFRAFSPDSYILSPTENTADGGLNFAAVAGGFYAGGVFYWATGMDGLLHSVTMTAGTPVATTAKVVGGPAIDGRDWRARGLIVSPVAAHGANQPPAATLTASCLHASCSLDASGSTDPETGQLSYSWNYGDGSTGPGASVLSHDFSAAGTYQVSVTVTDDHSLTSTASTSVTVGAPLPITLVGVGHATTNTATTSVAVPGGVQAGDVLLMYTSVNSDARAITVPAGWTQVSTRDTGGVLVNTVWSYVVPSAGLSGNVEVDLDAAAQLNVQLVAYRNVDPNHPVQSVASAEDVAITATHSAPAAPVTQPGSLAVLFWVDRSSSTGAWTWPNGVTTRDENFGTGSGYLSSLLADSGAAVPVAAYPSQSATTDAAGSKASSWLIVLNGTP